MAKKTDTTKPVAPTTAVPKTPAPAKRAAKRTVATKTTPAAKAVKARAAKLKRAGKAPARPKPRYTREDIALRAYFISEKRRAHGLSGDEHQDWIEAERQLLAESTRPKKAKKA